MSTILDTIASARQSRLSKEKERTSQEALERRASEIPPALDFYAALTRPGFHVIAEVKKASPSAGVLAKRMDARKLARAYELGGASAISVLTEPDYFMGDLADLAHVRGAATLPILRKDFLTDPYQVVETRAWGADSLLLIASLLDGPLLATLIRTAREWGMEPLVEAHNRLELEKALDSGARIVGINNRDLRTFSVSLETSLNLASLVPPDRIVVAESGIHSADDVRRLVAAGIKAALIGEALVKAPDATAKIGELTHGF